MSEINEKYKKIAFEEFQKKHSSIISNELIKKDDYKKFFYDVKELYIELDFSNKIHLINLIEFQNFLSKLENNIRKKLEEKRVNIFKEKVLNFNDDIITVLEKLYKSYQQEESYYWKEKINSRKLKKSGNKNTGEKEINKDKIERF